MRGTRAFIWGLLLFAALIAYVHATAKEVLMVLEFDERTEVEVFVNGLKVVPQTVRAILLMNSKNKFTVKTTKILPYSYYELEDGQFITVRATHPFNQTRYFDTDGLGEDPYFHPGGFIMASEDGTISNGQWQCTTDPIPDDPTKDDGAWKDSASAPDYTWSYAAVHDNNECCPWRDNIDAWSTLASQWIWAADEEATDVICRYQVGSQRFMDPSFKGGFYAPKSDAATLTIDSATTMSSYVLIVIYFSEPTVVTCVSIGKQYQLRPPTAYEMDLPGFNAARQDIRQVTKAVWFDKTTPDNFQNEIDHPILEDGGKKNIIECRALCQNFQYCDMVSISIDDACLLYSIAATPDDDTANGARRLLQHGRRMEEDDTSHHPTINFRIETSDTMWTHMYLDWQPNAAFIELGGGNLTPGTEYYVYCKVPGMSYDQIAATRYSFLTDGCPEGDCGTTLWPKLRILGGWLDRDKFNVIIKIDKAGKIYCLTKKVSKTNNIGPTPQMIRDTGMMTDAEEFDMSKVITLGGLSQERFYALYCIAEDMNGSITDEEEMKEAKRTFFTQKEPAIIYSISEINEESSGQSVEVNAQINVHTVGFIWCIALVPMVASSSGIPNETMMKSDGMSIFLETPYLKEKMRIIKNRSEQLYEMWCSSKEGTEEVLDGDDVEQETVYTTTYPTVNYASVIVTYTTADIVLLIDRQAEVACAAVPINRDPRFEEVKDSKFRATLTSFGGMVPIKIRDLVPGEFFMIYCYTIQLTDSFFKYEMEYSNVLDTGHQIRTLGPSAANYTAYCEMGQPCHLELTGLGLSAQDRILVRSESCRAECKCAGISDGMHKGAECTTLSQDPNVHGEGPFKEVLPQDPMGSWCYVVPEDGCMDASLSDYFDGIYISYKACENELNIELEGFPNNGLSMAYQNGTIHDWGPDRVNASAMLYDLCWCSGETSCDEGSMFVLSIGSLSVIGPTTEETIHTHVCKLGEVCVVDFIGQDITEGTLTVIAPLPGKCYAKDPNDFVPLFFPYGGLAYLNDDGSFVFATPPESELPLFEDETTTIQTATVETSELLIAPIGDYQLCFCIYCPKRETGRTHFASGGILRVIGPDIRYRQDDHFLSCIADAPCEIDFDGLQLGNDYGIFASTECGKKPVLPNFWFASASDETYPKFDGAGWYPVSTRDVIDNVYRGYNDTRQAFELKTDTRLGAFGFPNEGRIDIDAPSHKLKWTLPIMAPPGLYELCWIHNTSTAGYYPDEMILDDGTFLREKPDWDQYVAFGKLLLKGPLTLPFHNLQVTCTRLKKCRIDGMRGELSAGSRLLISKTPCSRNNTQFQGFPNNGVSFPSLTGSDYYFGEDAVMVSGGTYIMCWGEETEHMRMTGTRGDLGTYLSFAGELIIKSPRYSAYTMVLQIENATSIYAAIRIFEELFPWAETPKDVKELTRLEEDVEGDEPLDTRLLFWDDTEYIDERNTTLYRNKWELFNSDSDEDGVSSFSHNRTEDNNTLDTIVEQNDEMIHRRRIKEEETYVPEGKVYLRDVDTVRGEANTFILNVVVESPEDGAQIETVWTDAGHTILLSEDLAVNLEAPRWYCPAGEPCAVSGIRGDGLSNENQLMISVICGTMAAEGFPNGGRSVKTTEDGTSYSWGPEVVTAITAKYRLCWCERRCYELEDFKLTAGLLIVGGPPTLLEYSCYQYIGGCQITLEGSGLREGDRLMVIPMTEDCLNPNKEPLEYFPQNGYSDDANISFLFSWGNNEIINRPGRRKLCWCSVALHQKCTNDPQLYNNQGGILNIESKESYYMKYRPNWEPNDMNFYIWIMLAIPIPVLCIIYMCCRRGKERSMKKQKKKKRNKKELEKVEEEDEDDLGIKKKKNQDDHRYTGETKGEKIKELENEYKKREKYFMLEEVKFRRKDVKAKEKRLHLRIKNLQERCKMIPYYRTKSKRDDDDNDHLWEVADISDQSQQPGACTSEDSDDIKMTVLDDTESLALSYDRLKMGSKETVDTHLTVDTQLSQKTYDSNFTTVDVKGETWKVIPFRKWQIKRQNLDQTSEASFGTVNTFIEKQAKSYLRHQHSQLKSPERQEEFKINEANMKKEHVKNKHMLRSLKTARRGFRTENSIAWTSYNPREVHPTKRRYTKDRPQIIDDSGDADNELNPNEHSIRKNSKNSLKRSSLDNFSNTELHSNDLSHQKKTLKLSQSENLSDTESERNESKMYTRRGSKVSIRTTISDNEPNYNSYSRRASNASMQSKKSRRSSQSSQLSLRSQQSYQTATAPSGISDDSN